MRESFTQHKGNQVRGKPRESAVFVERCLTGKEIEQKGFLQLCLSGSEYRGFLQVCVSQVQCTEVLAKSNQPCTRLEKTGEMSIQCSAIQI